MAVPNIWFKEPAFKFMEEFNYYKLIYKHACFRDCIEKYNYKY